MDAGIYWFALVAIVCLRCANTFNQMCIFMFRLFAEFSFFSSIYSNTRRSNRNVRKSESNTRANEFVAINKIMNVNEASV